MNEEITQPEENLPAEETGEKSIDTKQTDGGGTDCKSGSEAESRLSKTPKFSEESRGEDAEPSEKGGAVDSAILGDSDDSGKNSDSDLEEESARRILELRRELNDLETQIAQREAAYARLGKECDEFRELYPGVSLEELPDSVWDDVKSGIPVAAAYALSRRRRELLMEKAERSNAENRKSAPEALNQVKEHLFSPAEVRKMTPAEVRENYEKIMQSMKQWN